MQLMRFARAFALPRAGSSSDAKMPMMAMTTSNSIRVNPDRDPGPLFGRDRWLDASVDDGDVTPARLFCIFLVWLTTATTRQSSRIGLHRSAVWRFSQFLRPCLASQRYGFRRLPLVDDGELQSAERPANRSRSRMLTGDELSRKMLAGSGLFQPAASCLMTALKKSVTRTRTFVRLGRLPVA
jgi:hypothetical protein